MPLHTISEVTIIPHSPSYVGDGEPKQKWELEIKLNVAYSKIKKNISGFELVSKETVERRRKNRNPSQTSQSPLSEEADFEQIHFFTRNKDQVLKWK